MSNILGIDVGVHGALALLRRDGSILFVHDMPTVEVKIGKGKRHRVVPGLLIDLLKTLSPDEVFVEYLHGMPGMGGATMFQLGYASGIVECAIAALAIPATFVAPAIWKRAMRVTKDKGTSRQRAMQLWPAEVAQFKRVRDDGRAEAALIARYGWLLRNASEAI